MSPNNIPRTLEDLPLPMLAPASARIRTVASRNVQIEGVAAAVNPAPDPYQCPHCDHYQHNHRKSDLRRHIKTHSRLSLQAPPDWICCGVPVEQAAKYGITSTKGAVHWDQGNMTMIGGCFQTFTRRGNFLRHFEREGCDCVGDIDGEWLPGNAELRR